jgi:type III restriction enzyme
MEAVNDVGATASLRFNTTRADRWEAPPSKCHINSVMLDNDGETELCRIAEAHPLVRAYAKNHHLGLEVPYR